MTQVEVSKILLLFLFLLLFLYICNQEKEKEDAMELLFTSKWQLDESIDDDMSTDPFTLILSHFFNTFVHFVWVQISHWR